MMMMIFFKHVFTVFKLFKIFGLKFFETFQTSTAELTYLFFDLGKDNDDNIIMHFLKSRNNYFAFYYH
jgi:hypothetical protein